MSHPRPSNGVIYLKDCEGIYTCKNGEKFYAPKNSIVWLTEKSEYECYNSMAGTGDTDAYLVQFSMENKGEKIIISDSPFLINASNNYIILSKMKEIVNLYEAALRSPGAVKGAVYSLISSLGHEYNVVYNKKYECIAKGIEYLEKNPTSETSIEDIAKMCNVSSATFRRLFKEYSGKSPVEFRLGKQIDMAKNMLVGEDMTLSEIASRLEIDNLPYFCKLFLKKTGMTPTEYKKRNISIK